jgi:3-oxoacyl-[acyl-carrier protein] reductase
MKVLVIGGSSGLGYRCAERLAAEGHEVTAASRRGTGPANVRAVRRFDLACGVNFRELNVWDQDGLLIAAGRGAFYGPHQVKENIGAMVTTNLMGPILAANEYLMLRRHRKRAGRAVVVTSTAASHGGHGLGLYAATKAGVEAWVRAEGPHQAKHGVDLMAASLGWFVSPLTAEIKPEIRRRAEARCPEGRFATLEEAADFTLKVLLDDLSYVGGGVYRFWEPIR